MIDLDSLAACMWFACFGFIIGVIAGFCLCACGLASLYNSSVAAFKQPKD